MSHSDSIPDQLSEATYRNLCYQCLRPETNCYCQELRPFQTAFQLVILQHPIERKKGIGTARMAHLCINNSTLVQGKSFEEDPTLEKLILDPENFCAVLFPSSKALDLVADFSRIPLNKRLVIFVIDGTWTQAKRMLRLSPTLAHLPHVSFQSHRLSQYKIRQQPMEHCLSTIESIHEIIGILEPKLDANNLLEVFNGMVKRQLEYTKTLYNPRFLTYPSS